MARERGPIGLCAGLAATVLATMFLTGCGETPSGPGGNDSTRETWETGRIAYAVPLDQKDQLYLMDVATRRTTLLSDDGHRYFDVSWAGGDIVFDDFDPVNLYQLYAVSPGGGPARWILPTPGSQNSAPAISKQGRVAYFLKSDQPWGVWIDGQLAIPAQAGGGQERSAWSPDGLELTVPSATPDGLPAFAAFDTSVLPATFKRYVLQAADRGDICYHPIYSPDGRRIAFTRSQGPAWPATGTWTDSIWAVDVDGSNLHRVSQGPKDWSPTWSPDGSQIAFTRMGDREPSIYVASADGTGEKLLIEGPAQYPAWVQ